MTDKTEVFIFWDSSAKPRPNVGGYDLVKAIRSFASRLGVIKSLRFYVDISAGTKERITAVLASELQCSGVSIIDTVSSGRKGASSKMLVADIFLQVLDYQAPAIVVITGDPDISYALSSLRLRGFQIIVLCPIHAHPNLAGLSGLPTLDSDLFTRTDTFPLDGGYPNGRPYLGAEGRGKGRAGGGSGLFAEQVFNVRRMLEAVLDEDIVVASTSSSPCLSCLSNSRPRSTPVEKAHTQHAPLHEESSNILPSPSPPPSKPIEKASAERPPFREELSNMIHSPPPPPSKPVEKANTEHLHFHEESSDILPSPPPLPSKPSPPVSVPSPLPAPYKEDDETSNAISAIDGFSSSSETELSQFSVIPPASFSTAPTTSVPDSTHRSEPSIEDDGSFTTHQSSLGDWKFIPSFGSLPQAPPPQISQTTSVQSTASQAPTLIPAPTPPPCINTQPSPPPLVTASPAKMTPFAPPFVPSHNAAAGSSTSTTMGPQYPPKFPPKFKLLVGCLRNRAPSYTLLRGEVDVTLRTADPDYLRKSGVLGMVRPVVTLLDDAFAAGIITSNTGDVTLSTAYRAGIPKKFKVLVKCLKSNAPSYTIGRGDADGDLRMIDPDYLANAGLSGVARPLGTLLEEAFDSGIITSDTGDITLSPLYRSSPKPAPPPALKPFIPFIPARPLHVQPPMAFRPLVNCLRNVFGFSLPRGSMDAELRAVDLDYLAKAGFGAAKKPVNKYLNAAFEAGIVTSADSAQVVLTTMYRT